MPFTNTEQDVLEAVFSPLAFPTLRTLRQGAAERLLAREEEDSSSDEVYDVKEEDVAEEEHRGVDEEEAPAESAASAGFVYKTSSGRNMMWKCHKGKWGWCK